MRTLSLHVIIAPMNIPCQTSSVCEFATALQTFVVWAWMFWFSNSLTDCLGMDDLVIELIKRGIPVRAWMLLLSLNSLKDEHLIWVGHGCAGHQTNENTNFIVLLSWMLWFSNSLKDQRHDGLGMSSQVIELMKRRTLFWFGYACARHRTH